MLEPTVLLETLITNRSLYRLFYNFRSDDIQWIRERSRDFDYLWSKYVDDVPDHKQTHFIFWSCYNDSDAKGQAVIIERALVRYRDEAASYYIQK